MHGITGILSVLLDPMLPRHSISITESYASIATTVTALCNICLQNKGHLPLSIPGGPSTRLSPLVQICHGAPGLLLLLALAKQNIPFAAEYWSPVWDDAIHALSDVIWSQGLLSKGAGLCHGIAGNALPLLLLSDPRSKNSDGHLGAGLAMLLESLNTRPFSSGEGKRLYRMPDHPFSLFEGLAGTLCAWSEACSLVRQKLRVLELENTGAGQEIIEKDSVLAGLRSKQLGFPCLGGGNHEQFSLL